MSSTTTSPLPPPVTGLKAFQKTSSFNPKKRTYRDRLKDIAIGYPRLAAKIEILPEIAMFRRFGALNARNLLYMQSELCTLEKRLQKLENEDAQSDHKFKKMYAIDGNVLKTATAARDGDDKQRILMRDIKAILKEYNATLIQQHHLLALKRPDEYDLKYIQNTLEQPEMGSFCLRGDDALVWGTYNNRADFADDLITLKSRMDGDSFSRWLAENAIIFMYKLGLHRFKTPDPVTGQPAYNDASVFRITFWMTSIIASLFPIISIAVLSCLSTLAARIGTIGAFNVLISVCLTVFTDAKRTDVFAVSAAFAAVQAVFVGQDAKL